MRTAASKSKWRQLLTTRQAGVQAQALYPRLAISGVEVRGCQETLRLGIARWRHGNGGSGQFTGNRALDASALIEDRGRDRPQADFTMLNSVKCKGLPVHPELVSIH